MSRRIPALGLHYQKTQESRHAYADVLVDETDIGKWYFRIRDLQDEFKGGEYLGEIVAPADYPFKPPAFRLYTPNGVFQSGEFPCVSIGHYHSKDYPCAKVGMHGFIYQIGGTLSSQKSLTDGIAIIRERTNASIAAYAAASVKWNAKNHPALAARFQNYVPTIVHHAMEKNNYPSADIKRTIYQMLRLGD